ncbi:MAG: protein kinase [Acidobacteria bacterium]|nr:protein kinase [Acidobacteriota bacterium]
MIGRTIAHYRVTARIGAGGMGEVYRATDTKLGRDVALKVLPEAFAADAQRMQRFQREAQVLASLNHPGIAAIYGFEEGGAAQSTNEGAASGANAGAASSAPTIHALVMELVEGPTLAERIAQGPIPAEETLPIALQIAEALEYAHERGIIHRDLKPANIKLTPDGKVKILDFGLAKALGDEAIETKLSDSPTISAVATRAGIILGTAAYMSPEQARGQPVDKRADIWSFGVVLWEMLTGQRLFEGATTSDTLAAVLRAEVSMDRLPKETPRAIRRLVGRCLERDPRQRLRDVGDARLEMLAPLDADALESRRAGARAPMRVGLLVALAFALGGAAAVLVQRSMSGGASVPLEAVQRFEIPLPSQTKSLVGPPGISPDGRAVSFVLDGRLWIRPLDSFAPIPVDGGEGAVTSIWSPDSSRLAFAKGAELWWVDAFGRRPQLIGSMPDPMSTNVAGGVWLSDGRILFTTGSSGIFEIPAAGGAWREMVSPPPGVTDIHEIAVLPGRDELLVTVHLSAGPWRLAILDGAKLRVLEAIGVGKHGVSHPAYAPSGHIVYEQQGPNGGVWAVPFSLDSLEVTGPAFKIASDGKFPAVDASGNLVYARTGAGRLVMSWVDPATGESTPLGGHERESIDDPWFSNDGSKVAYARTDIPGRDIWLQDLKTGSRVKLTFSEGENWYPRLSPDGKLLATVEEQFDPPGWHLRFYATDGSGPVGVSTEVHDMISFDRDWTTVVFDRKSESTGVDIWSWDMKPDHKPRPVIVAPGAQTSPALSPDGSWMAFVEKGDGRNRVFLTRFPDALARWQVSESFGEYPRWTPDGTGIMYVGVDGAIEIVDVRLDQEVRIGRARKLLGGEAVGVNAWRGFAMHPVDGRVLVSRIPTAALSSQSIAIVKQWAQEGGR